MLLYFVVRWVCGCGCDGAHIEFFGTHEEALAEVVELQRAEARMIQVVRVRLPRRKDAILAALNEAAGATVEDYAECEVLASLVRKDCPDCGGELEPVDGVEGNDELH